MPNIVVPNVSGVVSAGKTFFQHLGVIPSIILVVGILAGLYLIWNSASNAYHAHETDKQVAAQTERADAAEAKANQLQSESDQYKGAAAAYKNASDQTTNQITELVNAYPQLQKQTANATQRAEAARTQALRPVTSDMRQRVSDVGTKLNQLYPDQ